MTMMTRRLTDHFKKLLEETYPNHTYAVRHKLKDCSMTRNYMTTGTLTKGKKPKKDPRGKAVAPFPREKAVMVIYGASAPHEFQCKLKLTGRAVNAVSLATPEYLRWSKSPITFNWTNHPDCIPKPGRFPLIVDPLVVMTQLTKALLDGCSGLNLMYLDTFKGLGLARDQLSNSPHPFYRVVSGKQSTPLGKSLYLLPLET
jgi:hypothetical protein